MQPITKEKNSMGMHATSSLGTFSHMQPHPYTATFPHATSMLGTEGDIYLPDDQESGTPEEFLSVTKEIQQFTFINNAYTPGNGSAESIPITSPVKSLLKKSKGGRKHKRSENESPGSPQAPAPKKKKKVTPKTAVFDINDDSDQVSEPPVQSITAHLHLESSVEVVGHTQGKSTSIKLKQCNPFIFTVKESYETFCDAVAEAADTMVWHLAMSHLHWRFETPANLQPKLLANEVGYTAMITTCKSHCKDQVIFLYIPQPVSRDKPTIDAPGKRMCSETMIESDDGPQTSSLKSQIDWLRNRAGNELKHLQEKYPISNHPHFPNRCIYTSGGLFWELTQLHLQVWANAIAAKPPTATYDDPPMSNHFTKASAIPASQI
ncbi:hypothetical protein EDC04DRAFT_2609231 [Pisolithus marmoratus]|nr:hypothetical protein EDC04DRAFT_2609231 [Pisolithus marmoratus]